MVMSRPSCRYDKDLGDSVEIRIRDNGSGIPPEVKEKMFNPFFTTKPAGEGTGLGLSLSHDIVVKQHGGKIDVDTRPGEFTEFKVTLPRTDNLTSNYDAEVRHELSFLVVDDEPDVEALFRQQFRRDLRARRFGWILRQLPRRRWRMLRILLNSHQFHYCRTSMLEESQTPVSMIDEPPLITSSERFLTGAVKSNAS